MSEQFKTRDQLEYEIKTIAESTDCKAIRTLLMDNLNFDTYASWLRKDKAHFRSWDGKTLKLAATTRFIRDWIRSNLVNRMEKVLETDNAGIFKGGRVIVEDQIMQNAPVVIYERK